MNPLIHFNISHRKGIMNFQFSGEITQGITGIFGPSGTGKTTLLNILAGIEEPKDGRIVINNNTVYDNQKKINIPINRRRIGYVFQDARLFPHLTVKQNLLFGQRYLKKRPDQKLFEKITSLLELETFLKHKPHQLSGGQQQRVAIGRALLIEPQILFLDEPFSSLDRPLRKQIISYLLRINRHLNIPMLVVSHDLEDLLRLTQDLIIIDHGQNIAHDNYFNLCIDSNISNYLGSDDLLNIIDAKVVEHSETQKLIYLKSNSESDNLIIIQTDQKNHSVNTGKMFRVGIKPEDIAISVKQIKDISIQNQWKGNIKEITYRDEGVFCLIDCGFNLITEITHASVKKLGIEKGKNVYCLVKSKGIEVIHLYSQ